MHWLQFQVSALLLSLVCHVDSFFLQHCQTSAADNQRQAQSRVCISG